MEFRRVVPASDNAPAHTALSVRWFWPQRKRLLTHESYSPDLAPAHFFLFSRMKKVLKGKRFTDVEGAKRNVTTALAGIKFARCFQQCNERLYNCVSTNGEYFEDD